MGSVNKVLLVGRIGQDIELKYTQSNRAFCNMSLATSEKFKSKSGNKEEKTEWHRITVWGETAENCAKYLAKGRMAYVEGRLQTRSYEKDGQKRFSTEVIADRVVFLGGGKQGGATNDNVGDGSVDEDEPAAVKRVRDAFPDATQVGGGDIPF